MFDTLEDYFSSVLFVSDAVKQNTDMAIIANREGKVTVALSVKCIAIRRLFKDYNVEITDKLEEMFEWGTSGWIVDLDSLLTSKIRFYSYGGLDEFFNIPMKEFDHKVERTGLGFEYDVETDEFTLLKRYYQFNRFVNGNNREYVHYKYDKDGNELGEYREYGSTTSGGKHFKDTTGVRSAFANQPVTLYSTYREDADQTYLHIIPLTN